MTPNTDQRADATMPGQYGWRRAFFFSLILVLTSAATWVMADILWRGGMNVLKWTLLGLFIPLFTLVSFGFIQALCGFVMLLKGDKLLVTRLMDEAAQPDPTTVTALVFPVFNEDVSRVYEGLRAMYLDLTRCGVIKSFDFFILSDSSNPNTWIEEEVSWVELCKQLNAFGKIFYRKRQLPLNKKSGNISDFCRRWGSRYRYMIIMDADSILDATTMVRLTTMMDASPNVGIIQTVPQLVGGKTLFSRIMQFSAALYGPIFQAGMNFWQMSEGNYWGHNGIIRLKPFIEHCALPNIPGAQKRTRFMSHDYVEAALMRKAGCAVWLATGLPGSYEGVPPTLIDNAKRDQRWCRGNLQHSWLLFAHSLHGINKLHLLLGIMSYVSSLLWFAFLVLGTIHAYQEVQNEAVRRFDYDVGIASFLDIGGIRLALTLFITTFFMLVAPKLLSWLLVMIDREKRRRFGGAFRLTISIILEQAISMLMAPVQMLFNTQAVIETWLGHEVAWMGQRRAQEKADPWQEAFIIHASHTVIGLTWAVIAYTVRFDFFLWLSPVWIGLLSSVPLSIILGNVEVGSGMRRMRLLLAPSESATPPILTHLWKTIDACRKHAPPSELLRNDYGLMQAVLDPYVNAIHIGLVRHGRTHTSTGEYFERLQDRLLKDGPEALSRREKAAILLHVRTLSSLHHKLWLTPYDNLSPWWSLAMRQYNTFMMHPVSALHR